MMVVVYQCTLCGKVFDQKCDYERDLKLCAKSHLYDINRKIRTMLAEGVELEWDNNKIKMVEKGEEEYDW